ncbi:MAG: protein kinase [Deltaproteobacteria bacterium]|nr:protein kinase [Deltaproteobacteria bacterium]
MTKYCPICRERYSNSEYNCPADGMRLFDIEDPFVGRLVDGRYQVLEKIGSGGMGSVYRIQEESTGVIAAMKVLSPRLAVDPLQRARFFRESRVAQRIDHINVIKVSEIGETHDGLIYMVMEHIPGFTLAAKITNRPLPLDRVIQIGIQIGRGLGHAHKLGVIHRDVKPENVMFVSSEDEPDYVKLLDFGLAWMKDAAKLTTTGQVFGTPEYLSPEQARGEKATFLSDLYALGIVLYEMATMRVPFEGTATKVMLGHMELDPKPPSSVDGAPSLPKEFDRLVLKLLSKNPSDRYRDAHHLLEDLTAFAARLSVSSSGEDGRISYPVPDPQVRQSPKADVVSFVEATAKRWNRIEGLCRIVPPSRRPEWLGRSLAQLMKLLEEAKGLRRTISDGTSVRLKKVQSLRARRERLGRAVDIIASDESRLSREIEICTRQLSAVEERMAAAKMSRQKPPADVQARHKLLPVDIEDKTTRLQDVRFQLDQLRGRLAAMSAGYEHEVTEERMRTDSPSSKLERVLAEFDPIANRIEQFLGAKPSP